MASSNDKETILNLRYSAIRARALELVDNPHYEDPAWANEQFELNVEYLGICEELQSLGYTGIESFPGNED